MTKPRIGLTQRVSEVEDYGERRDCLDQAWTALLEELDYTPVPLSNTVTDPEDYLNNLELNGVIFTSGNDLAHLDCASEPAPERDAFETAALEFAYLEELPVLGVCRGLELFVDHFGGQLCRVDGHVACEHEVHFEGDDGAWPSSTTVNSYHEWAIPRDGCPDDLIVRGTAEDGTIECVEHEEHFVVGIMWHPERESPSAELDRQIITDVFEKS